MHNSKGQFVKGVHSHPATEFKPGEHWRPHQVFREREFLVEEYVVKGRSAREIAGDFGVHQNAIIHWLQKHDIPRRSMSETRAIKHWELSGDTNGMHGRTGAQNPRWRGGITPERQAVYSSPEWAAVVPVVWKRDDATCRQCGVKRKHGRAFHLHHIVPFECVDLRCDALNLVLLCPKCHRWVHSKANVNGEWIGETP